MNKKWGKRAKKDISKANGGHYTLREYFLYLYLPRMCVALHISMITTTVGTVDSCSSSNTNEAIPISGI